MVTSQPLKLKHYQTLTSWWEDFHANRFPLQETEKDSLTEEDISFLTSQGLLTSKSPLICCLRTSKGYSVTTKGKLLKSLSLRLMNWGMTANGKCLTANISDSHKTGSEYTLLDILEENPDPKYFLSKERTKNLVYKLKHSKH